MDFAPPGNVMSTRLISPEFESLDATVIVHKDDVLSEVKAEKTSTSATSQGSSAATVTTQSNPKPAPIHAIHDGAALQQDAEQTLLRSRLQTATYVGLACLTAFFFRSLFIEDPVVLVVRSVSLIVAVGCLGLLAAPRTITTGELRRIELLLFGPLCALVVYL